MTSIRLAMLPLLDMRSAATRAICERPTVVLRHRGIEPTVFVPPGGTFFASQARRRKLRRPLALVYWYGVVFPWRFVQVTRAATFDVALVQRGLLRTRSLPLLEALLFAMMRLRGRAVVYHCDDALHALPFRALASFRFRLASVVVTGSEEVAGAAEAAGARRVIRIEAGLDVQRYPVRVHADRKPVVIGWVGTNPASHLGQMLRVLGDVSVGGSAVLRVVSSEPFPFEADDRLEWVRWRPQDEFAAFADLDVGVMPLLATRYNRGKEAYKLKEYMAAGLPVVCSPVGHNLEVVRDGETGFFASSDEEWVCRLRQLVASSDLRARLGAAGRRRAVEHYDSRDQAEALADVICSVLPHRSSKWRNVA